MTPLRQKSAAGQNSRLGIVVPRPVLPGLLLAVATFIVFWPAVNCGFVNLDDAVYVSENGHVSGGLTWENVRWAFANLEAGFWQPLTWLSYLLDSQCFGLRPGWFHLTNVLMHTANSALLYLVLHRLTRASWRSWFVAALFALHPLHVESVAWIAERKDVLSGLFWMLTLLMYVRYAEESKAAGSKAGTFYAAALIFFVCGLMSKTIVVTLPLVLLLLDWWPLGRFERRPLDARFRVPGRLILEKLPFLAAGLAGGILTFHAEKGLGALPSPDQFPMMVRAVNATRSCARYLAQTLWPTDLAVFYPYPKTIPLWSTAAAGFLLVAVTLAVLWTARRGAGLAVGWFWYGITLLPVAGLIQVGWFSRADRYTYLPLIGVFFLVAWAADEAAARWRLPKALLGFAAGLVLVACALRTRDQLGYWTDSERLFRHAIAVTQDNYLAYNCLGRSLESQGRIEEAQDAFLTALQVNPDYADAQNNLGVSLVAKGQLDKAIEHYAAALRLAPQRTETYYNLGNALVRKGRLDEAVANYRKALQLNPNLAAVHSNLGMALAGTGAVDEAIAHYTEAIRLAPNYAETHNNLGYALATKGRVAVAIDHYRKALQLNPNYAEARDNLGKALFEQQRLNEALENYRKAIQINPNNPELHFDLGRTLAQLGQTNEAVAHLAEALRLKPEFEEARQQLRALDPMAPLKRIGNR